MASNKNSFPPVSVGLWICATATLLWSWIVTVKYCRFGYQGWDLGLYAQMMWNLCQGSSKTSLFSGPFYIDHANFIAYLLIPFYAFFKSALMLLYFKVIAFFAGCFILYRLALKKLNLPLSLLFLLGYMFYPANVAMLLFEFNFENLSLPLILLAFTCFEEKNLVGFIVSSFLLILVKENMSTVVFMFGIYGLFVRRENRKDLMIWGIGPLVLSSAIFILGAFWLTPLWINHTRYHFSRFWTLYASLGDTPLKVLSTLALDPIKTFQVIFTPKKIQFLLELFGPLLVTALLSPRVLLLGLPLFLQNLLSNYYGQQSIFFYYASTMAIFVFLASLQSFAGFLKKNRFSLVLVVLISTLIFNACYLPHWSVRIPWKNKTSYDASHLLLSKIPPQEGVVSSYDFLPFLSQREELYVVVRGGNPFTAQKQAIPKSVSYALVNFSSDYLRRNALLNFIQMPSWGVAAALDDVVLFRKGLFHHQRLIEIKKRPFGPVAQAPVGGGTYYVQLENARVPKTFHAHDKILPLEFYWHILADLPLIYTMKISIGQGQDSIFLEKTRRVAYGLPMKKGQYVKESFYWFIPEALPKRTHQIFVEIESKKFFIADIRAL